MIKRIIIEEQTISSEKSFIQSCIIGNMPEK